MHDTHDTQLQHIKRLHIGQI